MRIAILGTGGVGGFFGGRLAAAGADVVFIARGAHLDALRTSGLRIESPQGNLHLPSVSATDNTNTIGPVDVVFFTVKMYDAQSALKSLPPLIGPNTVVIPFQNGVEAVDGLARAVGRPRVAGGTAYISAVIGEPGLIRHTALGRLVFGPLDAAQKPMLEQLLSVSQKAGFQATLSERIVVDIWAKFVRLSVLSGITATARCPIGPILQDAGLRGIAEAGLRESIGVARAKQVPLASSLFDETMTSLAAMPPHTKSSMLEDLERGRRLELPWLSGAIVRIGEEVGVPTPTHRLMATLLGPHVNGRQQV